MPKKTTEKDKMEKSEELKKDLEKSVKVNKTNEKKIVRKTANKKSASLKNNSKTSTTTKKVKKIASDKKETKEKVVVKEQEKEKNVIEKIKAFISKIVAMQEEARLEEENKKSKAKKDESQKSSVKLKETADKSYMLEYYDLPYRYNETVVKILAQTPKRLFVYWDISDSDRQKYLLAFGEGFFEDTYPVLLVHNEDMNYTFEVPINDFANSWYLDINDSKAKYTIQLGRKFRTKPEKVNIVASSETEDVILQNDYVPIITSNMLEVPNDHILFENIKSHVVYRNVKTGNETTVEIGNLEFAKKIGHIYNIYDIYKEIYKNEMDNESLTDLLNPSSMGMSSSVLKR